MATPRLRGVTDAALTEMVGHHVYADVNLASAGNMFNVHGTVLIKLIFGVVTTVVATTTTIKFRRETGTVDMCAATTITSDGVGTMYLWSGDAGAILSGTLAAGDAPVVGFAHLAGGPHAPVVFGLSGADEVIEAVLDQAGTGVIRFHLYYVPLEAGAYVEAA